MQYSRHLEHRELAGRCVHGRRRRRQDEPALLREAEGLAGDYKGRVVLRSVGHQGWKADAVHPRRFDDFFRLLSDRGDSERSWTVLVEALREKGYDLKAVNLNAKADEDSRSPQELLVVIEERAREVAEIVALLRQSL